MMNKLEKSIIDGALKAQYDYKEMSGGWWLSHAPESFLQVIIAQQLAQSHSVYIDATIKKLRSDTVPTPGRPSRNFRKRPDIAVWYKDDVTLRAIIEIKRAWNFAPVYSDAQKIKNILKSKNFVKVGYLVIYSEIMKKLNCRNSSVESIAIMQERFENWTGKLGPMWSLLHVHIDPSNNNSDWIWGIGLLRCYMSRLQ